MSNVINFLERMGQDAHLRHASRHELEIALLHADIDPALQAAIMRSEQSVLEELLGLGTNVCCLVAPGKDEDDGQGEDRPVQDDDEVSGTNSALLRVAISS